jgi:hypothetical protein
MSVNIRIGNGENVATLGDAHIFGEYGAFEKVWSARPNLYITKPVNNSPLGFFRIVIRQDKNLKLVSVSRQSVLTGSEVTGVKGGAFVGEDVGDVVGDNVGVFVGAFVGKDVGVVVGDNVGVFVGLSVICCTSVGAGVGELVGLRGVPVGLRGVPVGLTVVSAPSQMLIISVLANIALPLNVTPFRVTENDPDP